MRKVEMTAAAVERFKAAPGTREDILDHGQPGLVLRVSGPTPSRSQCSKSWSVFHRLRGSRKLCRFTIGDFPTFSLKDARAAARKVRQEAAEGVDVMAAKREAARRESDTIEVVFAKFIKRHMIRKRRAPSYVAGTQAIFENHIFPKWRGRELKTITRREVNDLLDEIADGGNPIAANRVLAAFRKLCNWALSKSIIETTPTVKIEIPGEERKRERKLSDDEIRLLWPALDTLGYPFGRFLQVALLTGQRRNEVAGMRWADLDLKAKVWKIPSSAMKAGKAHAVPLSAPVLEIIEALPRLGDYCFATRPDRPIAGFSKAKLRLDKMLSPEDAEDDAPKIEPWTIHDLRRTAATNLAELEVGRFIIGRVLAHGDRSVTGIYDVYEYLKEKRAALDAWARRLRTIIEPAPENVVELKAAG